MLLRRYIASDNAGSGLPDDEVVVFELETTSIMARSSDCYCHRIVA